MLPEKELDNWKWSVATAREKVDEGRAGEGFCLLCLGLGLAKEASAKGETWGDELVSKYEAALEEFRTTSRRRRRWWCWW